ncbi:hypothetical protein D3C87_1601670 [compost metagenome]
MNIMDFTPGMGPAGSFLYMTFPVEFVEACIGIRLQHTAEAGKMGLRLGAFSVRAVREPDRRGQRRTGVTVVTNVRPQPPGLRLFIARQQDLDRRIVRMKFAIGQYIVLKGFVQW